MKNHSLATNDAEAIAIFNEKAYVDLRAGRMVLRFTDGAICNLTLDGVEIVQRVYAAVRDHNWETVPLRMERPRLSVQEDGFDITFEARHSDGGVDFSWIGHITGDNDSKVTFSFAGRANSRFRKNRIGLCLLSPLNCAGIDCELTHVDGKREAIAFPLHVSPHQPAFSIKSLRYRLPGTGTVSLAFDGEEFEMEDQRNWTDASFKTYCTPLGLPFPVEIIPGDTIKQRIEIVVNPEKASVPSKSESNAISKILTLGPKGWTLPQFGLTLASEDSVEHAREIINRVKPQVVCINVDVESLDESEKFRERLAVAVSGGAQLLLRIRLSESSDQSKAARLAGFLKTFASRIWAVLLIPPLTRMSDAGWLRQYLETIPGKCLRGLGVATHLAELNRNRPDPMLADFLALAANPQVHVFDDTGIMENLPGLTAALRDGVNSFAKGKQAMVVPLTLRNHVAEIPMAAWGDPRQRTLFAAAWVAGVVRALAEGQAGGAVFFSAMCGILGIAEAVEKSQNASTDDAADMQAFPVFQVLRKVFPYAGGRLVPLIGEPSSIGGYRLEKAGLPDALLLYNVCDKEMTAVVAAAAFPEKSVVTTLCADSSFAANETTGWVGDSMERKESVGHIRLNAYGVCLVVEVRECENKVRKHEQ